MARATGRKTMKKPRPAQTGPCVEDQSMTPTLSPSRRAPARSRAGLARRRLGSGALAAFLLACAGPLWADEAATAPRGSGLWPVPAGAYLRDTLADWSGSAGWTLIWDSPLDYRIRAGGRFAGRFEDAVTGLIDAIHRGNPELSVTLYRGNRVVHVETVPVETR